MELLVMGLIVGRINFWYGDWKKKRKKGDGRFRVRMLEKQREL